MISPHVLGSFAGEAGSLYEQSLIGMISVLDAAGETHWLGWALRSLEEWRASGETAGHRRAYGGMGSLNDLMLTQHDNDVSVTLWLDAALFVLRDSAYQFSQAAETGPHRFMQSSAPTPSLELHWHHCRSCSSGFITTGNVYSAASTGWASYAVPRLVSMRQADVIARAAAGEVSEFSTTPYVEHVKARYQQLGVHSAEVGMHWENPCPTCGATSWWYTSASAF